MIPSITIFTRHSTDCPYKDDEGYRKCHCRKWLRWSYEGKRHRVPTKSRSWSGAEKKRREIEAQYAAAEANQPVEENKAATVEQAINSFIADKTGANTAAPTISKYRLTLNRLLAYCTRHNLMFIREITLPHLSDYRAEWNKTYSTTFALRNEQSRVRAFFSYCAKARLISFDPAKALSPIKVRDEDYQVDPFTKEQYENIIAAVDKTGMTEVNKGRTRTLMELQRWSGLSLIDAVTLECSELVKDGDHFKIDTSRRKTGARVVNPIPAKLGEALLKAKNGNEQYFFCEGKPRSTSVWDKRYRAVFRAAKIPNAGSHRFRHYFAVDLLEHGADLRTVARALGNTLAVCERFYAAWSKAQQERMDTEIMKAWKE